MCLPPLKVEPPPPRLSHITQLVTVTCICMLPTNFPKKKGFWKMDVNPSSHNDLFPIDELLDFSNEDLFSSSSTSSSSSTDNSLLLLLPPPPPPPQLSVCNFHHNYHAYPNSLDFNPHLTLPNDDVAELEWLSRFVDDSFTDIPSATVNYQTLTSTNAAAQTALFPSSAASKARAKRSRLPPGSRTEADAGGGVRRCTHCASEKTPQWRTGPMGPKTLCNACGVRFKSGRLVPEYRPASSPTFVLTQHSNSHRKVLELRRQKEEVLIHHQNFGSADVTREQGR